MPIDGLTPQQEAFLRKYLGSSIFSRSSNKTKTKEYKAFLDAEAETQDIIDRYRDVTANIRPIEAELVRARSLNDEGRFSDAAATADTALLMARDVAAGVDAAREKKTQLLHVIENALKMPDGAIKDEIDEFDLRCDRIRNGLTKPVPPQNELDTAERAVLDLTAFVKGVGDAVAGRAKELDDLLKVQGDLATRNAALLVKLARTKNDGDHADMLTLSNAINETLGAIAQAISGADHLKVRERASDATGLPMRMTTLDARIDAALARLMTAQLADRGLSDTETASLIAVGITNPDAFDAAKKVIDDLDGDLGTTSIDVAEMDRRRKAESDAAAESKAKKTTLVARESEMENLSGEWRVLDKKLADALKEWQDHKDDSEKYETTNKDALEKPDHPDHAAAVLEFRKLNEEQRLRAVAYNQIDADKDAKYREYAAKKLEVEAAKQAFDDAKKDEADAKAAFDKADAKKKLLDAVSFGPLSASAGKPVSPEIATDLIALYGKNASIADKAVSAASTAEHPASVAKCANLMCDKLADGFKTADGRTFEHASEALESYSQRLVETSGSYDSATIDKLGKYIDDGRFADDCKTLGTGSENARTKARTEHVGNQVMTLTPEGNLNFDAGRDALLDVMFHPVSVKYATPAQAVHMLETFDYLEGSPDAQAKIINLGPPANDSAKGLLARGSGKAADAVDKGDGQRALVNAMMTPVYQGDVGSCFATAGIVKMRKHDPDASLENYAKLVTDGVFEPKVGDPVPAIQNVPVDEDPLVRSLEFTAATASIRTGDARKRGRLMQGTGTAVDTLASGIKSKKWPGVKAKIISALDDGFDYIYNPELQTATAADGSSSKGVWQYVTKPGGTVIDDIAKYQAAAAPLVESVLNKSDTKWRISRQDIVRWIDDEFTDALKVDGKYPWDIGGGGFGDEAMRVLEDPDTKERAAISSTDRATVNVGQRTKEVFTSVLSDFSGRSDPDDMIMLTTSGIHGFNGLPNDESLGALMEGGPSKVAENIQRELVDKGQSLATTDIPLDKAIYMFDKEMEAFVSQYHREYADDLREEIVKSRPTGAIRPGALTTLLETAFGNAWGKVGSKHWKAAQTKKNGGTAPSDEDVEARKAEFEEYGKNMGASAMLNRVMDDLGGPQFVLADTNWGSGSAQDYFVIAPDVATGEPKMYTRSDPPGTLRLLNEDDKWVATAWNFVEAPAPSP